MTVRTVSGLLLVSILSSCVVYSIENEAPVCHAVQPPASCGSVRGASTSSSSSSYSEDDSQICSLWRAGSVFEPGSHGVFTSKEIKLGDRLTLDDDILLPLLDVRKNEWSPWHDVVLPHRLVPPTLLAESSYLNDAIAPGFQHMAACSNVHANVQLAVDEMQADDDVMNGGVHRSKDPSAGSFSYYQTSGYIATRDLQAGEEIIIPCQDFVTSEDDEEEETELLSSPILPLDVLLQDGLCLDSLRVGPSTIPNIGRGAFSKRAHQAGQVIATSLLLHFDRSQVEMVQQELYQPGHVLESVQRDHGIRYTDKTTGQQLLINYAYSHPDINVMLVPLAPVVNFINHEAAGKANVYIRWPKTSDDVSSTAASSGLQRKRPMELFATPVDNDDDDEPLMMEFVALRNIEPNEEIFIDYGANWSKAWQEHVRNWQPDVDLDYTSASEFHARADPDAVYRTLQEQDAEPYLENLQTACFYAPTNGEGGSRSTIDWSETSLDRACLRPCDLLSRSSNNGDALYTILVKPADRVSEPSMCGSISSSGMTVRGIPAKAITIMNKPYTNDLHMTGAFRHEILLPMAMVPEAWLRFDSNPLGDFIPTPLKPGQLDHIRWADNGRVVMDNGYRLGLPSSVRDTLLEYCHRMGIVDLFREVTVNNNGLEAGDETYLDIHGQQWFLQRPAKNWHSNLHWLSPGNETAHQSYLQALSIAGFDDTLKAIGEQLELNNLVVYHVTFIAVSQSTVGYMHSDVFETGAKTFNVIVPLMKAPDAVPELDLQQQVYDEAIDGEIGRIGRYNYEVDVAVLMGDNSMHGTSAVDYRLSKGMRLAATVYIADVTAENAESISDQYTQAYPPSDPQMLLSVAGKHWRRDDPSRRLPEPAADHILLSPVQLLPHESISLVSDV